MVAGRYFQPQWLRLAVPCETTLGDIQVKRTESISVTRLGHGLRNHSESHTLEGRGAPVSDLIQCH
jgi:hypothetical protein